MKTSTFFFTGFFAISGLLCAQNSTPNTSAAVPRDKRAEEVGIAASDGITNSGGDILVTRNGVSQRLTKAMKLTNGVVVKPDGTIINSDGTQVPLRVDQILTFDGVLRDLPMRRNTNPGTPNVGAAVPGTTK